MNYICAFCVSLFLVSFAVAGDPGNFPKFCTRNATKCELASINVTCVESMNKDCVKDVAEKKADMTLASAYGLVENENSLKIIYSEKEKNITENFVKYYGLAVVRNGTKFNLNELRGKKSCHTGAGRTVGWNIPIGYLLFTKEMEFKGNVYQSVADYFSESCAPGVSNKTNNQVVVDDLCKLCNSTGALKCSSKDDYASYTGAFKCMAEGNFDRVGFVKQTTASQVFDEDKENKYGDAYDYQLLCKDGTKKALSEFKTCNIDKRPAGAVVTNIDASAETIKNYQVILNSVVVAKLIQAGMAGSGAEKLVAYTKSVKEYVGSFGDHLKAARQPDSKPPTFCTRNAAKCALVDIKVTCVEPMNKEKDCVKDVVEKKADMTLASVYGLVRNEDSLKIIYSEKEKNITEDFVKYYGLAVVRKGTKFNLNELKGKKSCHTGVGRTVGWNIPIGYLLFKKKMEFKGNVYQSVADYFSESCVPGVSNKTKNKDVVDDLCKLCKSTGALKCSSKDDYASYTGAFKCMADGNFDRVGFVKQTTASQVFAEDKENKYGDEDDYQLLCKDGTKKALTDFETCNIDKRPAAAVVTHVDASDETIKNYESIFKSVSITELRKAGIVGSGVERLVPTRQSVKEYVGSFGDHYKAVNQPDMVVGSTTAEPGAATAIHVSFALQVAAIFALAFLV